MVVLTPLCKQCRHWSELDFSGYKCKAFPNGIPEEIITSEHDHRKPYPGDNGIRYEPANGPSRPTPEAP